MIVADTSIWIEFLKRREPYFSRLRGLLEKGEVLGLSPVFGELLQGVKSGGEKETVLEYWKHLPKTEEHDMFIRAGEHSFENGYVQKGVGLIDASLVAAATATGSLIWTLDDKLRRVLKKEMRYD
jgi:predicted nucleic acid-binding protein